MADGTCPCFLFRVGLMECDKEYIGESSRTFRERFKEHQKAPSPIYDHYNITGHKISLDNFSIVGSKNQNLMRTIKEALYIRVNNFAASGSFGFECNTSPQNFQGQLHFPFCFSSTTSDQTCVKSAQMSNNASTLLDGGLQPTNCSGHVGRGSLSVYHGKIPHTGYFIQLGVQWSAITAFYLLAA